MFTSKPFADLVMQLKSLSKMNALQFQSNSPSLEPNYSLTHAASAQVPHSPDEMLGAAAPTGLSRSARAQRERGEGGGREGGREGGWLAGLEGGREGEREEEPHPPALTLPTPVSCARRTRFVTPSTTSSAAHSPPKCLKGNTHALTRA